MRPSAGRPEGWETDGFVPAVDVLAPGEVTEYRRLFDAVEARVGRERAEVTLHDRHFDEEFVWRLATHPRVLDAVEANGCMRVIPGSHRAGVLAHGTADRAGNLLSINQAVPADLVDERRAVSLPLRAGQMSLHHGVLLHSSLPNRSTRRRCGLTLRYVPPSVAQVEPNSLGQRWRAIVVRGVDRNHHFEPREVPWPA